MTSQVIFTVDTKLKQRAMQKAQAAGIPFASVLKLATKAYAEGRLQVDLAAVQKFNRQTGSDITGALRDVVQGKNISPRFSSVSEARQFLSN